MSEKLLTNKILKFLKTLPNCHAVKTHGNIYSAGQPDISGCHKGRAFQIEVKNPDGRGKLTELQKKQLDAWEQAGAAVIVADSLEKVETFVRRLGKEGVQWLKNTE